MKYFFFDNEEKIKKKWNIVNIKCKSMFCLISNDWKDK